MICPQKNEQTLPHQYNHDVDPAMMYSNYSNENLEEFHEHAGCVSVLDLLEAVGDANYAASWRERQRQERINMQQEQPTTQLNSIRRVSISSMSTTSDIESDDDGSETEFCDCDYDNEVETQTFHEAVLNVEDESLSTSTGAIVNTDENIKTNQKQQLRVTNTNNNFCENNLNDRLQKIQRDRNQKHERWFDNFCSAYPHLRPHLDDLRERFQGKETLLCHYLYSRIKDRGPKDY